MVYNIPLLIYHRIRYHRLSYKMGFKIPPASIGYGVLILHYSSITINPATKITLLCYTIMLLLLIVIIKELELNVFLEQM